jgi:two-component system, OmpR family, sensor histidine kinase QseC
LIQIAAHEAEETRLNLKHRDFGHPYQVRIAFQIWNESKVLVVRTANAPMEPLAPFEEGYRDSAYGGQAWRVFSRWDDEHDFLIQVGELQAVRDELANSIAKDLLFPALLGIPLAGVLIWFAVTHGLRPLNSFARELEQRPPDSIEPILAVGVPQELSPLLNALNRLFDRVGRAFEMERRFTADAAHELRSPLAALKTHVQVALGATSEAEKNRSLHQAVSGVDRASRLIEQLLTLARVDPGAMIGGNGKVDLRGIVKECVAGIAPTGMEKNISLELAEGPPCWIAGDENMLEVLARNLIDNAIRYTPIGGYVEVSVSKMTEHVLLKVTDSGPGIPLEERSKAFGRFYRILGTGEMGSGLGLAIVEQIARPHGASIALSDGKNGIGLSVDVIFPVSD